MHPDVFTCHLSQEEEWDKDIPEVSLLRVMKANAKEWWLILLGLLGSLILGCIYPAFAIFFGEVFEVFTRPADEILDGLHLWAGLFIVLGVVSGAGVFFKVCFYKGVFYYYCHCIIVCMFWCCW